MARARRGLHAAHRPSSARRTPTTCCQHRGRSTPACRSSTYTVDQIANGSRGLLEEVATGKVTGEEEYWSRTDLWDFQANVDGARVGFEGVAADRRARRTPTWPTRSTTASPTCRTCSTSSARATASCSYDDLTTDEVKELSDAVNALSEPLSRLTAAVLVPGLATGLSRRGLIGGGAAAGGGRRRVRRRARRRGSARPPTRRAGRHAARVVRLPRRAPGRHRHPRAGPAALRGLRRHHRLPRRAGRPAAGAGPTPPSR